MTSDHRQAEHTSRPVAVVTGAARGIGRAIAAALSKQGFDIAGIDIDWEDAASAAPDQDPAAEASAGPSRLLQLRSDIADLAGHGKIIDSIVSTLGRIDVLVNNAGVAPLERLDILDLTPESFDRVLGINLRGTFFFTQQVARRMVATRPAQPDRRLTIIFMTSISAVVSSTNRAEYCISKSGLSMAARLYADRLAVDGITVFEIRPGIIRTAMTAAVKEKYDRLIAEGLIPQGRWGHPEDVAKAVVTLASGALDYSTGAVIEVSGGMNIQRL
jgi:NAD(P)-dependent dehydrogenase (short-subunit alcohol dehydrogenase family)